MNYIDRIAHDIQEEIGDDVCPFKGYEELYRMYALLALVMGNLASAENVHDAWSAWAASKTPEHTCIVSYYELPPEIADLDEPFAEAIRKVADYLRL